MLVLRGRTRLVGIAAVLTVAGLVGGGCSAAKSQSTPIVVASVAPADGTTKSPSATLTPLPTPPATPVEEATPAGFTGPPVVIAVPATTCTGSTDNQAFWADVAGKFSWDAYCPVLPPRWYVSAGNYEQPAGGKLKMAYKGPGGATLEVDEGSFCTADALACAPSSGALGSANFGDLAGSLDSLSGGGLALYVAPGTARAYTLTGTGLSQETFVSIAAALVKVAKP
jgi:hypothetical protein